MSQTGRLTPNLDQQSTKVLNLTVLQRIDPFIEEILTTAAHVTFYEFNIESNQWSRKDVEGSLFVVKRSSHPRFQFIVMNRRSTENLVENLLGDFEYEVQGPYLLYRNQSQEVNGIWFYNPRECEEIASLFTRILNAYSKVSPKSIVTSSKSEFEELEATPGVSVFEGPPDPSSRASAATVAPGDNSVESFFSSVLNAGLGNSTSNVANSRQPNHSSAALPFSSHMPTVASSLPSTQIPPVLFSSVPASMPFHDPADTTSSSNRVTSLFKPPSFFAPVSSSSQLVARPISSAPPTAPTLQPPLNLQRPQATPMLQPPPPLTPPPSLSPFNNTLQPVITKEKVRGALLMLAQDDQFIDMFHRALLKVHPS